MPPIPRSLRAIRREFRVYFHTVVVQIELVSKPLVWHSQKSVWVFQDLVPQRRPENYSQEKHLFLNMLKSYWEHLRTNPHSLLIRFFGLHSLKVHTRDRLGRKKVRRCYLTSEIEGEAWGEVFAKWQSRGALKVVGWTLEVDKRR